jgi:hypothetical protein
MSHNTAFAGLLELDPGDAITVDGGAFLQENPSITDFFLRIGAVTHRHDAHLGLTDPAGTASGSVAPSGGNVASGQDIFLGYTLVDPDGGETRLSAATLVTTPGTPNGPSAALTATFDSTAGNLPVGQYAYAVTLNDPGGGESVLGPAVFCQRQPGFASGQVQLAGLAGDIDGVTYTSWNLWRAQDGSDFQVLVTGTTDSFTDTGLVCTDAARTPPEDQTGILAANSITATLPTSDQDASIASGPGAVTMNLYLSTDGLFSNPCLFAGYPVASGGAPILITDVSTSPGEPPSSSRSLGGAQKIDPDTDMLDFPYKRPVATEGDLPTTGNTDLDIRPVVDVARFYQWHDDTSSWTEFNAGPQGDPGTTGDTGATGDTGPVGPAGPPASSETTTNTPAVGDYTLVLSDAGDVVELTGDPDAGNTLTIPANADVAFPLGTVLELCDIGSIAFIIAGADGVTIDPPPGFTAVSAGQWATMGLRQRVIDEWVLTGVLVPA